MADPKVDAWMPLWIGAYLADTMSLTTQQHGAYLLLLFAYWRQGGPLQDDDEDLASTVKASAEEWIHLRRKLEKFFTVEGGKWSHKRADDELRTAREGRAKASEKARKAAEAKWAKERQAQGVDAPSIAQAVPKQCPTPSPTTSSLPAVEKKVSKASPSHPPAGGVLRFDEFWQAWPKSERKQDKKACGAKWKQRGLDGIADQILADVRTKRGTTKWADGFIEAPLVYLNNARWEDGVTPDDGTPGMAVTEWHETQRGVETKAASLGLPAWDGTEQFAAYKARVVRAAGVEPRRVA
jgi:uncharacterized protein YdaU (DUF1376 family)